VNPSARAVLGIDAAWTDGEPSGVALVVERSGRWVCEAVAPSYECFLAGPRVVVDWRQRPAGTPPDPRGLLGACRRIAPDAELQVAALDLPLATSPITRRRAADDGVSREFGARWCSAHSPTPARPGRLTDVVRRGFEEEGFHLATTTLPQALPALVEVYPHTALLALLRADCRVPYKVSKSRKYWPTEAPDRRRDLLLSRWRTILEALRLSAGIEISSRVFELPTSCSSFSEMKRYEDALDALVCAWVAIEFLNNRADPLGDDTAAIWTPRVGRLAQDDTVTRPGT
jgi:predicted RNase H-like nuclease